MIIITPAANGLAILGRGDPLDTSGGALGAISPSRTITAVASVDFLGSDTRAAGTTASVPISFQMPDSLSFTSATGGTGAGFVNMLFQDPLTFSGSTYVLNLTSGLLDQWGSAIAAARVKGVFVLNTGANAITLGGGSNPVPNFLAITLPPGGWAAAATPDATGWPVTASTAMNFTVAGTTGQTFQVALLLANV